MVVFAVGFLSSTGFSQDRPEEFREFLSKYAGREILLITMSSDSLQFADADSTQKFVVVLDEVGSDVLLVHRTTDRDKRSFSYPIARIRRITYLFGGRPYKRIVVELF
ncbi:MAG TPA: hypothetical protein VF514_07015 [Bacteroidota bacterium]